MFNYLKHRKFSCSASIYPIKHRNEVDYDREFDTVTTDSIISSPRKVELFVELAMNGYTNNKVFKGKVTWLAENNKLEHQLNAQVLYSNSQEQCKDYKYETQLPR